MDNIEQKFIQPNAKKQVNKLAPDVRSAPEVKRTIDQIKQILFDPRVISKKYDTEGRQTIKTEILEARAKSSVIAKNITDKKEALEQQEQKLQELYMINKEKVLKLKQLLKTIPSRLKSLFRIKDKLTIEIQTEIESIEVEIEGIINQIEQLYHELIQLSRERSKLPNSKEMLEAYYAEMKTMPLSNKEKRELLRPEVLAQLSTEEYIALWRRLNPYFLSHVTRQGFRDHSAMIYHSGGLQEFHDGLKSILRDQKLLRPPIAVRDNLFARDEASIRKFLESWVLQAENEREAKNRLNHQLNFSLAAAPTYPDKTAVHFAAQIVADEYYGGEKNNEVFFLYPSDVLASQYDFAFNGGERDFTRPQSETKWNDIFIWPSTLDNPGIPVDAGMVFLPKSTLVDPNTGSKYASEIRIVDGKKERVMIEDEKLVSAFVEWVENLTDESPAIQAFNKYKENNFRGDSERKICFEAFKDEIMKLGFSEDAAMDIIYSLFNDSGIYHTYMDSGQLDYANSKKDAAINILHLAGANWKRAENAIPAKEYWEMYFKQHPEQRPSHIVFYDGTPTTAVYEFLIKHDIGEADVSKKEGPMLGFDDRQILDMNKDPRAKRGYDELVKMSHRIIEEYYRKKGK